jgi:hypothetical protein
MDLNQSPLVELSDLELDLVRGGVYATTILTTPYGAASWGSTSQSGYSTGNTATTDSEVHAGTASNFGQSITFSGSVGTNYANQAASSLTVGGSVTLYSSALNTPGYQ